MDKGRVRVVAVIVLLIMAGAGLRGYVPNGAPPAGGWPISSLGAQFTVVAIAVVSLAILAIVVTARRPLGWRTVLIAVGVPIAWLLSVPLSPMHVEVGGGARSPADVVWILMGSFGLLLILIAVGTVVADHRRRAAASPQVLSRDVNGTATGPESLRRAAELGLAEVDDRTREPREAIIASYLAMEGELERAPAMTPQDADTPSDVLARAVETPGRWHAHSATQRVATLFEEALFSQHVMSEDQRDDAAQVLREVLSELRTSS